MTATLPNSIKVYTDKGYVDADVMSHGGIVRVFYPSGIATYYAHTGDHRSGPDCIPAMAARAIAEKLK